MIFGIHWFVWYSRGLFLLLFVAGVACGLADDWWLRAVFAVAGYLTYGALMGHWGLVVGEDED